MNLVTMVTICYFVPHVPTVWEGRIEKTSYMICYTNLYVVFHKQVGSCGARGVTIEYMKADTICKSKHMTRYCRVTECVWAWHICICSHMTSIGSNMVFCGIWD